MTMWFNRRPGDIAAESTEDPTATLVGSAPPDWVRLPAHLGGQQLRVLGHEESTCPKCDAPARRLELEDNYGVAECRACGFVWYRRRDA